MVCKVCVNGHWYAKYAPNHTGMNWYAQYKKNSFHKKGYFTTELPWYAKYAVFSLSPTHPKWTCCAMFHIGWYGYAQFKKRHFINMGTLALIVLTMQSMRYFTHWGPALPHANRI